MATLPVLGYADRFSGAPGETIRFMVSCEGPEGYRADLVRLIHGYTDPEGPGFKEQEVDHPVNGTYPGRYQPLRSGSYVRIDGGVAPTEGLTVHTFVWPTLPGRGVQGLVTRWSGEGAPGWACSSTAGLGWRCGRRTARRPSGSGPTWRWRLARGMR